MLGLTSFQSAEIAADISLCLSFILAWVLVAATLCDIVSQRIPNKITYSGFLSAFLVLAFAPFQTTDTQPLLLCVGSQSEAMLGAGLCFLITCPLWLTGTMGGGDVKLATFIGLLLGAPIGIGVFFLAHLLAAVFVSLRQAWRMLSLRIPLLLRSSCNPSEREDRARQFLPMAGFYGCAAFAYGIF